MKKIMSIALSAAVVCGSFAGYPAAFAADGELVANGGFESGNVSPWQPFCGSEIAVSADAAHGGESSMLITNRPAPNAGAIVDLSGQITAGTTYKLSAWVKYNEGPDTLLYNIIMVANDSGGAATYQLAANATAQKGEWTLIESSYTVPDGLDTTSNAKFYFETQTAEDNVYYDFYVDDVSIAPEKESDAKAAVGKTPGRANPLMGYDFGADPFAMEYNGRLYVYMTADAFTEGENGEPGANSYGEIHSIKVISSADLINWTDHGEIPVGGRVLENGAAKWATNSWAPSAVHKTIDGEEKFFLYFADNAAGIGVLVSDSPTGPFVDPIGEPLVNAATPGAEDVVWMFDPAVFIDDDGAAYMYFGGGIPTQADGTSLPEDIIHPRSSRVIKLGDDMISTEGTAAMIDAPGILEDSGIHKYNDTYYYSYCTNFDVYKYEDTDGSVYPSGAICYMTSDDPMGPFTYQGPVLSNPGDFFQIWGNNHHAIFEFKDNWYITYHARTLEKAMGYDDKDCRSAHINKVEFNDDGTMKAATADYTGAPIDGVTIDGSALLEAETIAYAADVSVERIDDAGNTKVTEITNGSWTSAANVDFGSGELANISARVLGKAGGTVEVRYDSVNGDTAGTIEIAPSDDWQTVTAAVTPAEGVHDVYFVYKGADGEELFDVNCWQFSADGNVEFPGGEPLEPVDPDEGKEFLFSDDFSNEDNIARYAPYADGTLSTDEKAPSGVQYGQLVYNFAAGWGDKHGMRMDITDIVSGKGTIGASVTFGSFYWGKDDASLPRATMLIEVESADGEVNTIQLSTLPDAYGDLVFDGGRATVELSGETDVPELAEGDKVFLCVKHGSNRHDYDNISIWTRDDAEEPVVTEDPAVTDDPEVTEDPAADEKVIYSDDFSTTDNAALYAPYTADVLDEELSGIMYEKLVYDFSTDWNDGHGMRVDITEAVTENEAQNIGASVKTGAFYWGNSDTDLVKARMVIEVTDEAGNVKGTFPLDEKPDSYGDLTFEENYAAVTLSGSSDISYEDGDKIYLCVINGVGYQDYDDIKVWTSDDGGEPVVTDEPTETPGVPEQDTRYIVFSDDFTTDEELARYAPYAEGTLSTAEDVTSGIDYGALVYNFAVGWGDNHGLRMDITDIVSGIGSFGVNAKFGSFYWGTSDADLARASMTIEITGADGAVKDTIQLSSLPESYNELVFDSGNRAAVYLSGETDALELSEGDKVYLCIKHGSGRHDYDDITIWTRDGAPEAEKTVKVYKPYLDGDEAVIRVSNTTDAEAKLEIYTASYENDVLSGVTKTEATVAAGADRQEIKTAAKAGDVIYVWDSAQKPYREATTLEEQAMLTSWTTAQMEFRDEINPVTPLDNSTIRQVVKLSETGEVMQLTVSNEYGKEPLVIDSLRFAKPLEGSMIDISTDTAVTFGGSESVTIPAGQTMVSDPVVFDAGEDGKIAITMHISDAPEMITGHEVSLTTTYIRSGGTSTDISMIGSETMEEWFFIASIDVMQSADNGVIVCLGDSITDGVGASSASNTWPALLNARLDGDPETAGLSVVNQGIGGNKVNGYSWGERARWRYERDVLEQKGVKYLILLEGINDIGGKSEDINGEYDGESSDGTLTGGIIDAYEEIIDAAHENGIKVIGATILPCGKSGYYEQGGEGMEAMRQKLNDWIRNSGKFDYVIDFDKITADPDAPVNILDAYDCGDGLHPSDAGYKAMADAFDLSWFK